MSFKQFLAEQAGYDWSAYRKVADYIDDAHNKKRYLQAIDAFQKGIDTKEIYNADYKDLYSYGLSRGIEKAWEKTFTDVYFDFRKKLGDELGRAEMDKYNELYYTSRSINSIKKAIKLVTPAKAVFPAFYQFLMDIQNMPEMLKELKGYIKSGRKPNEAKETAKAQFQAMVSHGAAKRMADILRQTVEAIRPAYEKAFDELYTKQTEHAMSGKERLKAIAEQEADKKFEADKKKMGERWAHRKPLPWWNYAQNPILMQKVMDLKTEKLHDNWKATVLTEAKRTVDEILEGFVAKNTAKLGAIVDKKQNLDDIQIVYNRLKGGHLENKLFVTFKDGARFTVYSQTIYKVSHLGTPFVQYPTRFTSAYNSDGSQLSAPDEESMNKSFH